MRCRPTWNTVVLAGLLALMASLLVSAKPGQSAAPPAATNLGTLGGQSSAALSVNDRGEVVGWAETAAGERRPFRWVAGEMMDLGTLPGDPHGEALAINRRGDVVGWSGRSDGDRRAVLWRGGRVVDLGVLPGFTSSVANGVNDRGQVVGSLGTGAAFARAFLWQRREMHLLPTLGSPMYPDPSRAYAINNRGLIVGDLIGAEDRAVVWRKGTARNPETMFSKRAAAYAVNDGGVFVGVAMNVFVDAHPVLWRGRSRYQTPLADLEVSGVALGINDRNEVVGALGFLETTAFLWKRGRGTDLNTLLPEGSGWDLRTANDINNRGQIVGRGVQEGAQRAFILRVR